MQSISNIVIKTVTPDEWNILRDLKIRALEQEPIAFEDFKPGMEKYLARTEEEWRARLNPELKNKVWLFAHDTVSGKYVGTIFVDVKDGVATVQQVFVDKSYRKLGIGKKLLVALIEKLKSDNMASCARLAVIDTQKPAISLYHSLGFTEVKNITNLVQMNGRSYREIEMKLEL